MMKQLLLVLTNNFLLVFALAFCQTGFAQTIKSVEVKKAGTLSELLTEDEKSNTTEIVISGKLNSSDVKLLRRMAGANDKDSEFTWKGQLKIVDISKAAFVNDKEPYRVIKASDNFKISWTRHVNVRSVNRNTGESTVRSREEYLEDLNDYRSSNSYRMLNSRSAGAKGNRIEQLKEGKFEYVLSKIDDRQWREIKNSGMNEFDDFYVDRQKGDSVYYLYYHTTKKMISANMFRNCRMLEKVILADHIEKIGANAFNGCLALREIVIPQKVESIAKNAFKKTPSLRKVSISKNPALNLLKLDDDRVIDTYFRESSSEIEISRY